MLERGGDLFLPGSPVVDASKAGSILVTSLTGAGAELLVIGCRGGVV